MSSDTNLLSAGSAMIELITVRRIADGQLDVEFGDRDHEWNVRCTAAQIQTFSAFQRIVASKPGLWIRHDCEQERRSLDRAEAWQDDVSDAFSRGARA